MTLSEQMATFEKRITELGVCPTKRFFQKQPQYIVRAALSQLLYVV